MATLTSTPTPRIPRVHRHPALLTSEEFLNWLKPGIHADLIGGFVFKRTPVSMPHAHLLNFLDRLLGVYIEEENLGQLFRETVAVRLSTRETFLPDLAYFTNSKITRLPETHAPFAPAFVTEVLSPATAKRDTELKFAAYELHGVQEYWILDPQKLQHRFYKRNVDVLEEFSEHEERVDSVSIPGFWIKRAWLNPAKLPSVSACLAKIVRSKKTRRSS